MKTVEIDLCSINPNVNGIYYNIESYNNAVKEYLDIHLKTRTTFLYRDFIEEVVERSYSDVIGIITAIDLENRKVTVDVMDPFIEEYDFNYFVIGFQFLGEGIGKEYNIYHITYAALIFKNIN